MTTHKGSMIAPEHETNMSPTETDALTKPLAQHLAELQTWRSQWPEFDPDPTLDAPVSQVASVLSELVDRLTDNFPFFHPGYAGQMLKPPHPVAILAYALTQTINPNNHANDGGPATSKMEIEAVADLAAMFGFERHLGHLTAGGTIANLEALWVGRQLHPCKAVAYSSQAHYTHGRMAGVLGLGGLPVAVDRQGRMDLDALEEALSKGGIGTVVATAGTTSYGSVDPIPEILVLCRQHGARVHVDAAYGGFYRLLAGSDEHLDPDVAAAYRAIAECDSVVVDPHKHGLQPYGCGSVLFNDPGIATLYQHESPVTYFTEATLHLGEISLECSRAGAAAAALWATLRVFPLRDDMGLGPVLAKCRAAAKRWATLIDASTELRLVVAPALDIICFYPVTDAMTASSISAAVERIFAGGMADPANPVYLAKIGAGRDVLVDADIEWDTPTVTILRSCLMKPEHLAEVPRLHDRVITLAAST